MHIAFIGLPLSGHINPTLETVRELVRRGHRVTYPTTGNRVAQIAVTGASPKTYQSTFTSDSEVPGRDQWMTQMRIAMVGETSEVLPQLLALYEGDLPDLVVHDRAAFAGRLLAAKHKLPTVQIVPTFAANERWAVTHKFAPVDTSAPEHKVYQTKLKELLERHEIAWEDLAPAPRQISYIPKAFQYHGETFGDDTVFVGPCLRPATGDWKPRGDGKPVLLVAMGTMGTATADFYRRCLQVFDDSWHVVMSIGDRLDPATLGLVPANFEVLRFVPQLDVLAEASALICHGGMGSTMEALYFGVPTVQVPTTPEQEATAARVVELGLGDQLALSDDPRPAVERVASDQAMAQRIQAMRQEIRNAPGATLAADVIEGRS